MPSTFLKILAPFVKVMPEVKTPEREVAFKEKFIWTAVVLLAYLIMANLPLWGITRESGTDYFYWWRVLLASNRGTLMELGIGPIVTAGLIMQMLSGSKLIDIDFSDPDDRSLFTGAQKVLAIFMTIIQIIAYMVAGAYGQLTIPTAAMIFIQLIVAGIIVILLDELLQKGWGLGSGVSLFIAAGVCQTIIWSMFSPFPANDDQLSMGIIVALFVVLFQGGIHSVNITLPEWPDWFKQLLAYAQLDPTMPTIPPVPVPNSIDVILFQRPYIPYVDLSMNTNWANSNLPTLIGFIATIIVFVIVIWLESVRVEIPLQYAKYRGFKGKYPIKLLYVSNIPVILVQALYANVLFFSQLLFRIPFLGDNPFFKMFANFQDISLTQKSPFMQPKPGCLVYYLTPPRGINYFLQDPIRGIIYMLILVVLCTWFSKVWLDVAGIAPRDVSHQILQAGLMVPGFRPSPRILERILDRYIPTVTIIGGICVGIVAAFADFLGSLGTGMGVLLTVGIIYQYYQIIAQEQMSEMHPAMRGLLGLE
ncbi:MAG: preprotein translocase subunit SecY [Candidatus Helarchaeota archaeon]